ncbi:hypothetical protein EW026_g7414 [Hermanssonia centrifuga]|uniref:4-hydroxy-3-methoxy-5-polyprenylbenzoate decarboxylase n=1 Tax=Hermanssonia centrifuga TaxID=98765 RepID=A0A4S4KCD0_9APHY|nr:hypothetical protein EW026_g7414 [Hermanssonia centrifuga]
MSLMHPQRDDMVAAVGDLTSGPVLPTLRDRMLASPEGRRILKERPRINTKTVDMQKLALLPEGTVGHAYVKWLERCGVTPDTREPRYRECHDFYHCIVNLPVDVTSELAVKFFEFANLGLPMAGFAAAFGHLRLSSSKRERLFKEYVPWAIKCGSTSQSLITVYWEERWSQNMDELKKELGLWDAPETKWRNPSNEAKAAAARKQKETEFQL